MYNIKVLQQGSFKGKCSQRNEVGEKSPEPGNNSSTIPPLTVMVIRVVSPSGAELENERVVFFWLIVLVFFFFNPKLTSWSPFHKLSDKLMDLRPN